MGGAECPAPGRILGPFRSNANADCGSHGSSYGYPVSVRKIALCPLSMTKGVVTPLIVRERTANCGLAVFGSYGRPFRVLTCGNVTESAIRPPMVEWSGGVVEKTGRVAANPRPRDGAPWRMG